MGPQQQMHEKFIFASCWDAFAGGPIGNIHKMSAHLTRQTAISEGWEADWVGNDVADELAKDARPEVDGHGQLWVTELRQAAKAFEAAVTAVPAGFMCRPFGMGQLRRGKPPRATRGTGRTHSMVFAAGRWACQTCGAAQKRPQGALDLSKSECPGRHRILEQVHISHQLLASLPGAGTSGGTREGRLPFVMWASCGYFASSRIVALQGVYSERHGREA